MLSLLTLLRYQYQALAASAAVEALLAAQRNMGPIHLLMTNALMAVETSDRGEPFWTFSSFIVQEWFMLRFPLAL